MENDSNFLNRRQALKRIGVTAITGLGLVLNPSVEGHSHHNSNGNAEQPAKKDEHSAAKGDSSKIKRIGESLPRERAHLLTPRAKNLTTQDLLSLGKGERTAVTASLTVNDINSIKAAFPSTYRKYMTVKSPGGIRCCSSCCLI